MRRIGNAIAVAIAKPATPPIHVAYVSARVATMSERYEILIFALPKARTISRIPRMTATATTTANISR